MEGFLVHKPKSCLNNTSVQQLGLELTDVGAHKVSLPFGETSLHGVFSASDCANPMKPVATVISLGGIAASGVAAQVTADA